MARPNRRRDAVTSCPSPSKEDSDHQSNEEEETNEEEEEEVVEQEAETVTKRIGAEKGKAKTEKDLDPAGDIPVSFLNEFRSIRKSIANMDQLRRTSIQDIQKNINHIQDNVDELENEHKTVGAAFENKVNNLEKLLKVEFRKRKRDGYVDVADRPEIVINNLTVMTVERLTIDGLRLRPRRWALLQNL